MYINFKYIENCNLKVSDYMLLMMINQSDIDMIRDTTSAPVDELVKVLFKRIEDKGLIKYIKGTKKQDALAKVRLSKKGNEFLSRVHIYNLSEEDAELLDEIVALFESYDKETGNMRRIIENFTWFRGQTSFSAKDIKEGIEDWLDKDWNMWLENMFWDKKKANVFTTINSRELSQSPFYEFMRRKLKLKY